MIARIFIFLLRTIRPFLGPASCRFYVSCTHFAILQLETQPLRKALALISKRLLSCNPFWPSIK